VIGIDTNVLLRLFLRDDADQQRRAVERLEKATADRPALVNDVVLCEFAWTLGRGLKVGRRRIADLMGGVLASDDLDFVHRAAAEQALAAYRTGRADYADYLIAEINAAHGCSRTLTFDRKTVDSAHFEPIA
jgi:predicted nucleic-acid-binding protein